MNRYFFMILIIAAAFFLTAVSSFAGTAAPQEIPYYPAQEPAGEGRDTGTVSEKLSSAASLLGKISGNWKGAIQDIPAGTVLSEKSVKAIGEDALFYVEEINDRTFARMWGKSFKEYCTVPRSELRYIRCLHKDIDGNIKVGELVMNKAVADVVCDIFRQLYDASFPIESMLLVDEFDASDEASIMVNNTSAFNYRTIDNTDQISRHAYGLAIDINPYYNVYYIPSENYIFPPEGWDYLNREEDFPYKVAPGDLCYELFTAAGFEWGGWWTYNTDYQHFQYPMDVHYE